MFNLHDKHMIRNARLDELQAENKRGRRNIKNLRYVNDTTLTAENEEKLNSLLMRVKEEHERASLTLNIKKSKIMASGPITVWQIEGRKVEVVTDFLFSVSKITDIDCRPEIKRPLLLGRKVMINLVSVLKSRIITLPTKVHIVKAVVFPEVVYGGERYTIKKAERQGIDVFELWCWRRLLKVL